jgi:hypothetical protein
VLHYPCGLEALGLIQGSREREATQNVIEVAGVEFAIEPRQEVATNIMPIVEFDSGDNDVETRHKDVVHA